jgi:predicted nucleotidyltransferase
MISSDQKDIIKCATEKFRPSFIGIFGSYARGEETEASDLDILVDFEMKVHLLDLIGIEQELSNLLRIKVDLVTLRSLHPSLKPLIEEDLIRLV